MSLSKPRTNNSSPVQRRFELKLSNEGASVSYYDRTSKENVSATTAAAQWNKEGSVQDIDPFEFIVLDVRSSATGWHQPSNSGIWSNEVENQGDTPLTVRTRDGVLAQGLWKDIRDTVTAAGGKFTSSVYIAYRDGDGWQLGNLKIVGAALSAWIEFQDGKGRNFLTDNPGVAITGWTSRKNGATKFYSPIFDSWVAGDADLAAAVALDETLQQFLSAPPAAASDEDSTPSGGYSAPPLDEEPPF